jgi:hypothetical protein
MMTDIETATAAEVRAALLICQPKKGVERSGEGLRILHQLNKAPGRRMLRDIRDANGTLDAHFGWVCRRAAEALGVENAPAFALCDREIDARGREWLVLKENVAKALAPPSARLSS